MAVSNTRGSMTRIAISTTIRKDIYDWIKGQTTFANWVENVALEVMQSGLTAEDIKEVQRRMRFFANKTVDLQAEVKTFREDLDKKQRQIDRLEMKIKELELR